MGDESATIIITKAGSKGTKLKEEKGINLPDTHLELPSLTDEDIRNLLLFSEVQEQIPNV